MAALQSTRFVIFAPHSHKVSETIRDCDLRARRCVEIVSEILTAQSIPFDFIDHAISREVSDLNRFHSRSQQPRRSLRDLIFRYYDDPEVHRIALLELHSFPLEWTSGDNTLDLSKTRQLVLARPESAQIIAPIASAGGAEFRIATELLDVQAEFAPGRDKILHLFVETNEREDIVSDDELRQAFTAMISAVLKSPSTEGPTDDNMFCIRGGSGDDASDDARDDTARRLSPDTTLTRIVMCGTILVLFLILFLWIFQSSLIATSIESSLESL